MARVHFGSGILYGLYERPIYKRTLPSESFIENVAIWPVTGQGVENTK